MKRFLKWFFGILLTLIIVIISLAIALPYMIDPNDYKEDVIAYIKESTGQDAQINGDIKLSFFADFPNLNAEINEVVILNADGFVVKPFITFKNISINLDLISLLSDEIEVGTLALNEPVLNLQRDAEGRNNWNAIVNHTKTLSETEDTSTAINTEEDDNVTVRLDKVEINQARVIWDDQFENSKIQITKIDLNTGPVDLNQPIAINGKFNTYFPDSQTGTASSVAVSLFYDKDKDSFEINDLNLNTNIGNNKLFKDTIKTSVKIPNIRFEPNKVTIAKLNIKINKSNISGYVNVSNTSKRPKYAFNIQVDQFFVDDYLPKESKDDVLDKETVTRGDESIKSFQLPKKLIMQGTVKIGVLHIGQLTSENVDTAVFSSQGNLSFLTKSDFYGGQYESELHIQTATQPIRLRTDVRIENADLGKIARIYKKDTSAAGKLKFSINLLSEGNNANNWVRNLNGDGRFTIRRAQMTQAELDKLLLGKWYEKLNLDKDVDPNKILTVFQRIRGNIRIKSGVIYNKDFQALSSRIIIDGFGFTSLISKKLDYTLHISYKKDYIIDIDGAEFNLKGKAIPVEINGYWENLDITLAVVEAAKGKLTNTLKQERQKIERKISKEEQKVNQQIEKEKSKFKEKLPSFLQ